MAEEDFRSSLSEALDGADDLTIGAPDETTESPVNSVDPPETVDASDSPVAAVATPTAPEPVAPAAPAPVSAREYAARYGINANGYQTDEQLMEALIADAAQARQLREQVMQWQQQQRFQPQMPMQQPMQGMPQAPVNPNEIAYDPMFDQITITPEGKPVNRLTGLEVPNDLANRAFLYHQQQQARDREFRANPEKFIAPMVEQRVQQMLGQQLHQYQQRQAIEQEGQQVSEFVMRQYGDLFFQKDMFGRPDLSRPTLMGQEYQQHLQYYNNLPYAARVKASLDAMIVNAYNRQQSQASPHSPVQAAALAAQPTAQAPASPGEQQRQALQRAAHRNPSAAGASERSMQDMMLDPNVDIHEKLRARLAEVSIN